MILCKSTYFSDADEALDIVEVNKSNIARVMDTFLCFEMKFRVLLSQHADHKRMTRDLRFGIRTLIFFGRF